MKFSLLFMNKANLLNFLLELYLQKLRITFNHSFKASSPLNSKNFALIHSFFHAILANLTAISSIFLARNLQIRMKYANNCDFVHHSLQPNFPVASTI